MIEESVDTALYPRTFLTVVMSNLLRNALHYTDTGAVRLILEHSGFRLEDSGIGISPQQRDHLFEPFSRGDPARGEGLGLGLSLVKRICTQQRWSIHVSALTPGGTCFRVVTHMHPLPAGEG